MLFCLKKRAEFLRPEDYKKFLNRGDRVLWREVLSGQSQLDENLAQSLARGIFKWAKRAGAEFYCHKFFPFTNKSAQKLTSFLGPRGIGKFSGSDLLKTELDASSFPCGSARSTDKARGYAIWDIFSPVYIDKVGSAKILVIPSLFFGFDGNALDDKTPLLRALNFLDREGGKLLRALGQNVEHVYMTLGLEQEYFLIDRAAFSSRPDLAMTGRTLLGAKPCKSQVANRHYFSMPTARELAFMTDLKRELNRIGIYAKIQHCEVAPHQFEVVPEFDRADISATQNAILIEKLQSTARRHDFCALVHEKPFEGLNGSGKHNNWSLCTDSGTNLFDKAQAGDEVFALLVSCTVAAVDKHARLLRLASSSFSNDMRLGGLEAPPSVVSLFMGEGEGGQLNLHLGGYPKLKQDGPDRNRTSPFAFTGNKFEFRMLGSNQSVSFCNMVIAAALADEFKSVNKILAARKDKIRAIKQITKNNFEKHKRVIFNGDNYSAEWVAESKNRGLKNYANFSECIDALVSFEAKKLFLENGIFSARELAARHEVMREQYLQSAHLEAKVLSQMLTRDILPNLIKFNEKCAKIQKNCEKNAKKCNFELNLFENINFLIEKNNDLNSKISEFDALPNSQKIQFVLSQLLPLMQEIRARYDILEPTLPSGLMNFKTYDEILNL